FEQTHQRQFGFISPENDIVVEAIDVEVICQTKLLSENEKLDAENQHSNTDEVKNCYIDGQWQSIHFYHRNSLAVNEYINGPTVIFDSNNTIVVERGWRSKLTIDKNLILERYTKRKASKAIGTDVDPVMLEIFNNLFMSIAEQMGTVLEKTAVSVNIKERMDFSCAIFDPTGSLVANAPHVPVHLGSMSESIKTVIREHSRDMTPGSAYILNTPYNGGTHLPDITVIKPMFSSQTELLFYTAARGHHTDIGGTSPGSAPADSVSIVEEGVVIDTFKIVENGRFRDQEIHHLLTHNRWPARNPAMNIADIKAQLAACEKGAEELNKTVNHYGVKTVHAYMKHVQNNAEESVRRALSVLEDGNFKYEMDDGHHIVVSIKVDQKNRKAIIDFTGTSSQHPGNFNAPTAVVKAAVLYVFRCLVDDNIPLNDGCLKPFDIIIPQHSMINPEYPAAVFAGNVETSQFIVDALFGALGVVAASQGTMNNFVWGNEKYQYYETLCGGTGATRNHDGTDAVHSHMTNSKLTDPEVLEWRFPVILNSFEIKTGSGGKGRHCGGNGVIRKVQFLEYMTANIISSHRKVPPYGLAGGESAQVGNNRVEHTDGSITQLSGVDQIQLSPGDVFVIETPGGGGYGDPDDKNATK
ncbi:MAG: hydantoinase B/oxoprolinase family protein, partial [Gammaproteobacteria bacterium]